MLNDPLKGQIFIDNNEFKSKINIYTTVKHTEKGGLVEE